MSDLPLAVISVPAGWEASTTIELVEPPKAVMAVPLALNAEVSGAPRANLSIRRWPAKGSDPATARKELLEDVGSYVRGLRKVEDGTMTFDDGVAGLTTCLEYPTPAGARVAQLHAFREDGDVLTHLTASVEASEIERLDRELLPLIRSFRPK